MAQPPALVFHFRSADLAITVVLGIVSIPVSLLGEKGRILHGFARFWSQLIMKIVCSPTT